MPILLYGCIFIVIKKAKTYSSKTFIISFFATMQRGLAREIIMTQAVLNIWNIVMEHDHNPLKHIGDIQVRHIVLQILAWMWCVIFAMSTGSITLFGVSAVAHSLPIAGVVGTVASFEVARTRPNRFVSLGRSMNGYPE